MVKGGVHRTPNVLSAMTDDWPACGAGGPRASSDGAASGPLTRLSTASVAGAHRVAGEAAASSSEGRFSDWRGGDRHARSPSAHSNWLSRLVDGHGLDSLLEQVRDEGGEAVRITADAIAFD